MIKNKIVVSLFTLCVFTTAAFGFEVKTLPNGQTVVVEQVKNNPIVIIDTWVKTGSINESDKNTGVSHFLEHLLFKGSENLKTGEFDKILESKGGQVNAATSKDFTHYYVEIPSKHFDTALELHSQMLLKPTIPVDELEKERLVVIEEISKDLNNPNRKVYENFISAFYKTHPYKRKVIGTKKVITNISRAEILEYYNRYYIPQNMITIVVGDVEPNKVFNKIQEKFNAEKQDFCVNQHPKEKPITKQAVKIAYEPVTNGYLIIGYRGADISNDDTYALDILSTILGDGRSSILYKKTKDDSQLAISISASNGTYKEDGIFMIDATFEPQNLEALQETIFSEIEKIANNGVTDSQLNLAKKRIETETKYSRESVSNIASQIGYLSVLADTDYYQNYLKNVENVTASDVQVVAKKYLSKNQSVVSIVMPNTYKKQSASIKKPAHKVDFVRASNGIKKYTLDNGSTLLINKHSANDIVSMSIYAKGGNFLEEIPATSNLTASTMLKGTKKYSKEQLDLLMEENGIKISPESAFDTFVISVVTTKQNLAKTLEILDELVNNATFPENEIEKSKMNKLNSLKTSLDMPLNKALDGFREMIYADSPYSMASKKYIENYPKITRNDILNFYNKIFDAQNIVISVNGNVELSQIVSPLSEIFKKKSSSTFSYKNKTIPTITAPKTKLQTMKDLSSAWIFYGFQTCGVQNEKDYATLTVIDSILGSGMSSRLFTNLRDKEGLAYQIASSYSAKLLKGAFILYIGTSPETVDKSLSMLKSEVNKLKTIPVSATELQEAKDKVMGRYILSQETNLDKASQIGWFETSDRGFDYGKKYETLINSVTPDDILRVANKYFTDNNVLSIIDLEGK